METLITLFLAFFASQKLILPHINLAVAVFVAVLVALTVVDTKKLPFFASLILKLIIFAAVESAVLISLNVPGTP
jgi:hypothetical protein